MKKYNVYYEGEDTGIVVNDRCINMAVLCKVYPNAHPTDLIEFKEEKEARVINIKHHQSKKDKELLRKFRELSDDLI